MMEERRPGCEIYELRWWVVLERGIDVREGAPLQTRPICTSTTSLAFITLFGQRMQHPIGRPHTMTDTHIGCRSMHTMSCCKKETAHVENRKGTLIINSDAQVLPWGNVK